MRTSRERIRCRSKGLIAAYSTRSTFGLKVLAATTAESPISCATIVYRAMYLRASTAIRTRDTINEEGRDATRGRRGFRVANRRPLAGGGVLPALRQVYRPGE